MERPILEKYQDDKGKLNEDSLARFISDQDKYVSFLEESEKRISLTLNTLTAETLVKAIESLKRLELIDRSLGEMLPENAFCSLDIQMSKDVFGLTDNDLGYWYLICHVLLIGLDNIDDANHRKTDDGEKSLFERMQNGEKFTFDGGPSEDGGVIGILDKMQEDTLVYSPSAGLPEAKAIVDFLKNKITEEVIASRFDLEVLEWVEDDWADEFDSEADWYAANGNGEAETEIRAYLSHKVNEFFKIDVEKDYVFTGILELFTEAINWKDA